MHRLRVTLITAGLVTALAALTLNSMAQPPGGNGGQGQPLAHKHGRPPGWGAVLGAQTDAHPGQGSSLCFGAAIHLTRAGWVGRAG